MVSIGNCLTSVFAGFVIFSYLGAFAKSANVPVDAVVDSGKLRNDGDSIVKINAQQVHIL